VPLGNEDKNGNEMGFTRRCNKEKGGNEIDIWRMI